MKKSQYADAVAGMKKAKKLLAFYETEIAKYQKCLQFLTETTDGSQEDSDEEKHFKRLISICGDGVGVAQRMMRLDEEFLRLNADKIILERDLEDVAS